MCVNVVCVCTSFLVALSNTFQWNLCLYVYFRPSIYFLCPFYFKISLTLFDWCSFRWNVSLVRLFFHVFHWKWIGNWIDISVLLCTCNTHTYKNGTLGNFIKINTWNDAHLRHCIIHPIKMQLGLIFPKIFFSLHSQMEFQTDWFHS